MKKFSVIIIIFFSLQSFCQFSPAIKNFNLGEYNAGNQNWDITRADDGKVYVANNSGLLEYDSKDWKFYQLPNKTTVRSVLSVDDTIYTGSYEEFGYWKKNKKGLLKYNSLSENLKNKISPNEEIWGIVKFQDKIIFRSFLNIYIYDNNEVKQLRPKSTIISFSIVDNNLYICTLNKGIFLLDDDVLTPFYFNKKLLDTKIISLKKHKDKLLLMTSLRGSYYLENKNLVSTNFDINDQIKQNQLNEFSLLSNGKMIFGTIKDGLYLTDSDGKLKFHISKENGLLNNTVLGQWVDASNNLWLGLDNGIASIDIDSPNWFYNDVSGKLGAVYDIVNFNNVLYIGSNTGLFLLNSNDKLEFIEGSQGQVWDLQIIDNELFCGHNEGTFLVKGSSITKISDFTGGWIINKVPELKDTYIQGTYTGLVKFKKQENKWEVKHMGKTTMPSRFLVFENPYNAWVAHAYKGIYKVQFDKDYDTILSVDSYEFKGINSNYNIRVYNIKNDIIFKTNNGWQKYEPILDSIVPYELLNKKLGKDSYIISEKGINPLALKDNSGFISLKSLTEPSNAINVDNNYIKDRYIVGYEHVSQVADSIYALNLNNGFMFINTGFQANNNVYQPIVETLTIGGKYVNLSKLNEDFLNVKHNENITIELSSAQSNNHFFEYSIAELGNEWDKIENRILELSSLVEGEYSISLRTKDGSGNISSANVISIDVLPPWYKGNIGYALYILLILIIAGLFYFMHHKKVQKEQRLLKIKLRKEQQEILREKTLENEKRIVQLRNESLQNEITIKSKQLANTAMALVKKNEMLQEIKKELAVNREGFNNFYSYKKLIKRVDNSIERNDEWEVFEENFNQVHDEFFEILKRNHPKLTSKDLKICAYIKMNLATKEIAPLMNISIRGVETHRYRLKKKLNLENDISLSEYLLNIK